MEFDTEGRWVMEVLAGLDSASEQLICARVALGWLTALPEPKLVYGTETEISETAWTLRRIALAVMRTNIQSVVGVQLGDETLRHRSATSSKGLKAPRSPEFPTRGNAENAALALAEELQLPRADSNAFDYLISFAHDVEPINSIKKIADPLREDPNVDTWGIPLGDLAPRQETVDRFWTDLIRYQTLEGTWSFWREWYQGFLDGKPLDWELQRRVALIPDEDWEKGPARIAAIIEQIRAKFELENRIGELERELELASSSRFEIGGNSPPEPVEDSPKISKEFIVVWEPLQILKEETTGGEPNKGRLTAAIEKLKTVVKTSGVWVWDKTDRAANAAAIAVGTAGGTALIAWLSGHGDNVLKLIEAAEHWLGLLK